MTHKAVHRQASLFIECPTFALTVFDGSIYQVRVMWLVRRSEKQRRIGRGILEIQAGMSAIHIVLLDRVVTCGLYTLMAFQKANEHPREIGASLDPANSHSKSPVSETTVVPVCLR